MAEHFDVIIIGAGISGIDAALHMKKMCPKKSFVVLERRSSYGGTWDIFKYPGIRSDSDMFTFGYGSQPWKSSKPIAQGAEILAYLKESMVEGGVQEHVRYDQHILRAAFCSETSTWTLECETGARYTCGFLWGCAGYYDHDQGYEPEFKGRDRFEAAGGEVVHPQKWKDDLSHAGKRVVVIGSGATAISLVPAMAQDASHVAMLQRSPTYIIPVCNNKRMASNLGRVLPPKAVHSAVRARCIAQTRIENALLRRVDPADMSRSVIGGMRKALPEEYMSTEEFEKHFTPWYKVGEQRPCKDPDNAFFNAIKAGKASVVTDQIKEFDERGIVLESGDRLDCDIIVTATGFVLQKNQPMASMQVTVDGTPYVANQHMIYKGCMLSGVPNFAFVMGYFNASWTLKADITCDFICRLLQHMEQSGYEVCCPQNNGVPAVDRESYLNNGKLKVSSGYIKRGLEHMPWTGTEAPWTPLASYMRDKKWLRTGALEDGVLLFDHVAKPLECCGRDTNTVDSESTVSRSLCSETSSVSE